MLTWAKIVRDYLRCQKGQGMVEYGLILAVIAVVAVGAFALVGTGAETKVNDVATEITKAR